MHARPLLSIAGVSSSFDRSPRCSSSLSPKAHTGAVHSARARLPPSLLHRRLLTSVSSRSSSDGIDSSIAARILSPSISPRAAPVFLLFDHTTRPLFLQRSIVTSPSITEQPATLFVSSRRQAEHPITPLLPATATSACFIECRASFLSRSLLHLLSNSKQQKRRGNRRKERRNSRERKRKTEEGRRRLRNLFLFCSLREQEAHSSSCSRETSIRSLTAATSSTSPTINTSSSVPCSSEQHRCLLPVALNILSSNSDTWRKDVKCSDIKEAIDGSAPGKLKALFVSKVSRVFHPNFAAKWRRYFYIFPLEDCVQIGNEMAFSSSIDKNDRMLQKQVEHIQDGECSTLYKGNNCHDNVDIGMKPSSFSVDKVNQLFCQLEGRSLSYTVFARDTKAFRSSGPPTECFIFHARAVEAKLPCTIQDSMEEVRVMCVELVSNRFLRKMVRVLVSTAIREAAAGANADALIKLMDATCRRATAPPAPPDGLCLVDVGYEEFKRENCLIL